MSQSNSIDERVSIAIDQGVAEVRLARPGKMNALDLRMFRAIAQAIDILGAREDVCAVVLSGEGPAFCAGIDLAFAPQLVSDEGLTLLREMVSSNTNLFQQVAVGWRKLPVPVIAALHGFVLGGGMQIALGADMRFCAPDTKLSILEVRRGIVPDMGGTVLLQGLVRDDLIRDLMFSARLVEAPEAQAAGLVTRICDDPRAEALLTARTIAASGRRVLSAAKALANSARDQGEDEQLAAEREAQDRILTHGTFDIAAGRFVEKA